MSIDLELKPKNIDPKDNVVRIAENCVKQIQYGFGPSLDELETAVIAYWQHRKKNPALPELAQRVLDLEAEVERLREENALLAKTASRAIEYAKDPEVIPMEAIEAHFALVEEIERLREIERTARECLPLVKSFLYYTGVKDDSEWNQSYIRLKQALEGSGE